MFTESVIRTIVAKICQDVGWHSAHMSSLNVLSDILLYYVRNLTTGILDSANHAGRTEPTFNDLELAFKLMSIDINQLKDYVLNVESASLDFELPYYPLPTRTNRVLDNVDVDEERDECYDEWLPTLKVSSNQKKPSNLPYSKSNKILTDSSNGNDLQLSKKNENENNKFDARRSQQPDESKVSVREDDEILEKNAQDDGDEDLSATKNDEKKLVFKINFSKSLDENATNSTTNENGVKSLLDYNNKSGPQYQLVQASSSADILNHFATSKAFNRFLSQQQQSSSLLSNLEDPEYRKSLRPPDTQRLPNDHKSRENTPEPVSEPEKSSINSFLNSLNLPHGVVPGGEGDGSTNGLNVLMQQQKKAKRRNKPKDSSRNDIDSFGFNFLFDPQSSTSSVLPNIKVKEIGSKKDRKSDGVDGKAKKSRETSKVKTSIKVTSFNFDGSTDGLFGQDGPPLGNTENLPQSLKKQNNKRKPPKEGGVERRGRKKKIPDNQSMNVPLNLDQNQLEPLFSESNLLKKQKKKRPISSEAFGEDDAAKMLVWMSGSNDGSDSVIRDDDSSRKFNLEDSTSMFSSGNDSLADFGDASDSKSASKKFSTIRAPTKRSKGVYSKKVVKSAEMVESSDDSSSDDNPARDQNPVSLLPPPPELSLDDINNINLDEERQSLKRMRYDSGSDSDKSSHHSIASSNKSDSISESTKHSILPSFDTMSQFSSNKKDSESSKIKDSIGSILKHKKNKKHSKNKHHHRHGEEKSRKKHHKKSKEKPLKQEETTSPLFSFLMIDQNVKEQTSKRAKKDTAANISGTNKDSQKPKVSFKFGLFNSSRESDLSSHKEEKISEVSVQSSSKSSSVHDSEDFKVLNLSFQKAGDSMKKSSKESKPLPSSSSVSKKVKELQANPLTFIREKQSAATKTKEIKEKNRVITVGTSSETNKSKFSLTDDVSASSSSSSKKETKKSKIDRSIEALAKAQTFDKQLKKKEKSVKKQSLPDQQTSSSQKRVEGSKCILLHETINENVFASASANMAPLIGIDEEKSSCPICRGPDEGDMICCDKCDVWYHFRCQGIEGSHPDNKEWFCLSCRRKPTLPIATPAKKSNKKTKDKRFMSSVDNKEDSVVTITPIRPLAGSFEAISSVFPPQLTITPIPMTTPTTKSKQLLDNSLILSPTTRESKPAARPRGRPRKDSTSYFNTSPLPSVTITPIQNIEPALIDYPQDPEQSKKAQKTVKEICLKCQMTQDLSVPLISCSACEQWYHWPCAGLQSFPSPDSRWLCSRCRKQSFSHSKKHQKQNFSEYDEGQKVFATSNKSRRTLGASSSTIAEPSTSMQANQAVEDESTKNFCGKCKQITIENEELEWIACDECDQWYHFKCVGIVTAPEADELWFCKACIERQRNIENLLIRGNRSKNRFN